MTSIFEKAWRYPHYPALLLGMSESVVFSQQQSVTEIRQSISDCRKIQHHERT